MKVHAINLEHRTDRWNRLQEIERATPGLHFERVPGIRMPSRRGWIGCTVAHQSAVFEARLRGDPYVIVAEDDLELAPGVDVELLERLVAEGERLEYGALYGGTVSWCGDDWKGAVRAAGRFIIETDFYLSAHLVVYYARSYEAVLRWPYGFGADYNHDTVGTNAAAHLRSLHPVKRGLVFPFVAIQRDDYSDNCEMPLALAEIWKNAERTWQSAVADV